MGSDCGIVDDNLRLALVQALISDGVLPAFDRKAFVLKHDLPRGENEGGWEGDPDEDPDYRKMYEIESELLSWLERAHLPMIEAVSWGGGQNVQHWIWTFWDGESDEFDIADLTGLSSCSSLKRLSLWACNAVTNVAPLANLAHLESLALVGDGITDVGPLMTLPKLAHLDLSYARYLTDLSPLANHAALATLDLSNTGVTDLSFARTLPMLKKLTVSPWGGATPIAGTNAAVLKELAARAVVLKVK